MTVEESNLNHNIKLLKNGYQYIQVPKGYPNRGKNGIIHLHRYIFQEHHKCCILKWIDIHHINNIRTDNRIENLLPLHHSKHLEVTHRKNIEGRICLICKSDKTLLNTRPTKRPIWRKYKDGFLCNKCYMKKRMVEKGY